ncbi:hypothetical protein B0H16DRAFT_1824402 [Mycena metata]|uniref:Uncharacterized protein n=1 Tax=Mycena metata TaxID=1033252 RepID=A0AAD7GX18_9AGAR|nr:hypothetical protein B0H16DRAFT_1824402 [Mycena metata]
MDLRSVWHRIRAVFLRARTVYGRSQTVTVKRRAKGLTFTGTVGIPNTSFQTTRLRHRVHLDPDAATALSLRLGVIPPSHCSLDTTPRSTAASICAEINTHSIQRTSASMAWTSNTTSVVALRPGNCILAFVAPFPIVRVRKDGSWTSEKSTHLDRLRFYRSRPRASQPPASDVPSTATQKSGQAAIASAQATVTATDKATRVTVAASSLSQVGQAAIDVASKSVDAYKNAGVATLNAAKASVDALSKSGEWLAYQFALAGLKAAQSSTHELDLATGALNVAEKGGAGLLQAADYAASHSLTFVDIHYIRIECDFDKTGSVAGKSFTFDVAYDPRKATEFINNTFQKLLDEIENNLPH